MSPHPVPKNTHTPPNPVGYTWIKASLYIITASFAAPPHCRVGERQLPPHPPSTSPTRCVCSAGSRSAQLGSQDGWMQSRDTGKVSHVGSPQRDAGWEYPRPDPHGSSPTAVPRVPPGTAPGKNPEWPKPGTCAGEPLHRAPEITSDKTGGMKPSHTEKGF